MCCPLKCSTQPHRGADDILITFTKSPSYNVLHPIDCPAPMYYFNCSSAGPGAIGSECQKSCKTQDMHCVRASPSVRSVDNMTVHV